ncbi:UNVERIFIED_CONTAM: hypothetical protein Scaly_0149500 [Sesamum calycinum]|uniref:Uncharacterized protein n=1 Tax=Sesamum calycinum TaxID=2727403 RepID=A0AAW2SWJ3_9LAMI
MARSIPQSSSKHKVTNVLKADQDLLGVECRHSVNAVLVPEYEISVLNAFTHCIVSLPARHLPARPLLEAYAIDELVDPHLRNNYSEHEVYCSWILEGDMMDSSQALMPGIDVGNRSGRIWFNHQPQHEHESPRRFSSKVALNWRSNYSEKENGRTSYEDNL